MKPYVEMRANAPSVPPETCPEIDGLSTLLDAISGDLTCFLEDTAHRKRKTYDREEVRDLLLDAVTNLASARFRAEELRKANESLRECGRYWHNACREDA